MKAGTAIDIHELFAKRHSPRSLNAGADIGREDLLAILEAARWAPSASNIQPWRFLVGVRGDEVFTGILETLVPFNQAWAHRASVLIAVAGVSTRKDGTPNTTFMYDCGLAAAQLTLEAHHRNYVAHQMAGFDKDKANALFSGQVPIAIIAIGRQASADQLDEKLAAREIAPRERKELSEIVLKGLPN